jgi:hypothetical protein
MAEVSPTRSRLFHGSRPLVLANDLDAGVIKIKLRDEDDEPVVGKQVEISSDDTDGVTIIPPNLTDNAGEALAYVRASRVGPVTVRARVLLGNQILSSGEALQEIAASSAGTLTLADTLTINFYARGIDPKPTLPSTSPARNIHLSWSTSRYYFNDIDGIRVRIEADDANNMPTKIFAYQLLPVAPGSEEQVGTFDHVCSVVDLEEYPEDNANVNARPAWFRLNYVDIFLRSREEVRAFINAVLEDVQILKNTLDVADDLQPAGDVWIGPEPEPEEEEE